MSLKTQLPTDMTNAFLNSDEFAESITYTPYNNSAKTIKAIIVRNPIEPGDQNAGRTLQNECTIYIATDATEGIATVTKGQDMAKFPENIGGTGVDWRVVDIIDKDEGMWTLKVMR